MINMVRRFLLAFYLFIVQAVQIIENNAELIKKNDVDNELMF